MQPTLERQNAAMNKRLETELFPETFITRATSRLDDFHGTEEAATVGPCRWAHIPTVGVHGQLGNAGKIESPIVVKVDGRTPRSAFTGAIPSSIEKDAQWCPPVGQHRFYHLTWLKGLFRAFNMEFVNTLRVWAPVRCSTLTAQARHGVDLTIESPSDVLCRLIRPQFECRVPIVLP